MICPQTKAECSHNCSAWMISCKEAVKPPPPTLAEIERLADAYGSARAVVALYGHSESALVAAKAALMAAIQKYGRE